MTKRFLNGVPWTEEEVELLAGLANESPAEISKLMAGLGWSRSPEAIKRKLKRLAVANAAEHLLRVVDEADVEEVEEVEEPVVIEESEFDYTEAFARLARIQEDYAETAIYRSRGFATPTRKIVSLSDIHFPFARLDLLELIFKHRSDADVLVLNGDLLEGFSFSVFEKHKEVLAIDEYRAAFDFVEMCSRKFPKVVLVGGNHDARAAKALARTSVSKTDAQLFQPNLLARIANGERIDTKGRLVEKVNFTNVVYELNEDWYVKIGKTLFVHPHSKGLSQPGHTVAKLRDIFHKRYTWEEVDSIVCGHTHQLYKGFVNSTLLIEQGCLAGFLDYAFAPNIQYTTSGSNGIAVIYQDDEGNTNFNMSGPVYLGEVMPPKKAAM